jgi:hypothetical protein
MVPRSALRKLMRRQTNRLTVGQLTIALLFALPSNPGVAADVAFRAYLGIPLGSGSPYFGFGAGLEAGAFSHEEYDLAKSPRMEFELRYGTEAGPAFLVNGFPITRSLILNASDGGESHGTENQFDWRAVLGAALGIGLIVAIANADDVTIKACSGTNCPPEEKPPPQPDPTDPGEGT